MLNTRVIHLKVHFTQVINLQKHLFLFHRGNSISYKWEECTSLYKGIYTN